MSTRIFTFSSAILLVFAILMMSSSVNCQINSTSVSELSSLILTHLGHTLDSLGGFARMAEILGSGIDITG